MLYHFHELEHFILIFFAFSPLFCVYYFSMLQLQRASAGSGKTEQLARRYLQLFLNPEQTSLDPAAVVATTFTREAAGEIVARIFRLLARACVEEPLRASLITGTTFPIPTQETCRHLLQCFVNRLDRLSIGTIDALFAQQARFLALDLGLSSPWEVADTLTSEELAREALLVVLKVDPKIREAWSLLHHGTRILSFVEKGASLFEKNRWIARTDPLHEEFIKPGPPHYFEETKVVQEFLNSFEIPINSKGKPDSRWVKALDQLKNFFSRPLLLKDFLEGGSLLRNCLKETPTFYGNSIPDVFINFFLPFLRASVQEQQRLEALREAALRRMMLHYEKERQAVSFHAGKYTFSEIEEAVQTDHHHLSIEEIELRMDLRTEHLLLDEYQDTSQRQHDFLSPLVGNVLAKGGEVFVVGDVKQGIYGWRGGKRHLLDTLGEEYHTFEKKISPLNQSYRSSRAVLEAVNEVFGALKKEDVVHAMDGGTAFQKAAARWSADFQPHSGAPSVAELLGRVRVHSIPENAEALEDPMDDVLEKAVTLVEEHHQEDSAREVAILVRRTKLISPLLQQLQKKGIVASGEGGNPLTDTLAVELILSLLTWIDHPGNTAAYEHVFHSPLRDLVDQRNAVLSLRERLIETGIASTLRSWIAFPAFQAACSTYERGRLEQLMALVEKWEITKTTRLSALVKRIRHERVETPLPANVRVLTFHAAKGLEFESVILMDLDVDITAGGERSLRVQEDGEGHFFIQGSQETMALQGRSSLLIALQEEQWSEMLSLLYVGMTRASSYLDLIFFEKPSRKKTMAQWLRISGLDKHEAPGKSLRSLKPHTFSKPPTIPTLRPPAAIRHKFSQRHPSEEQEGGLVFLGKLLQGKEARAQGTRLHARLAALEWLEEELPFTIMNDGSNVFRKEFFLKKWQDQQVTQLELWRERRFSVIKETTAKDEIPELISGIFDRVIIGKNETGIPIVAEVIDFKMGNPEQHLEMELLYQPQLKAYRIALQELLPSLKEISTRLVWVEEK